MTQHMGSLSTIEAWEREEGAPAPLGATWVEWEQAWNFSLYSRAASSVTLLIYDADDVTTPILELAHDPLVHKTGRIWHCMITAARVPTAAYYAYRVDGPSGGRNRFVPAKVLCDPYAQRLHFPAEFSREAACGDGPNDGMAVLGCLPHAMSGEAPAPPAGPRHTHDTVIYEAHVKGFTARGNSGVSAARRGTFGALIEKIPYLTELGITVLELLPVQQFDPQEGNYWGYMTLNFIAPHHTYAIEDPVTEFRDMVAAMHVAGIEVWLDVVYNHTCEGVPPGRPTTCGRSTTTPTTLLPRMARTWTTPRAATPPKEPTSRCGRSWCATFGTGPSWASTGSGSTWPPSWPGTPMGRSTRPPPPP